MKPQPIARAHRKSSAKGPHKPRGNMTGAEISPLFLQAKDAFAMQVELANIPPETNFDKWREEQVMEEVGLPGLSCLDHQHFDDVMAHFAELAGDDAKALKHRLKSGKVRDHGPEDDTHEKRRQFAALICDNLAAHMRLAKISPADLAAQTEDTAEYNRLRDARAAILAHPKGAYEEGFIVWLARDKTSRKDLTLGRDIQAGLADRCTVKELRDILSTLRNRISTREGRADAAKRAPGYRRRAAVKKAKARALDTPAGTAHRPLAKPSPDDPF